MSTTLRFDSFQDINIVERGVLSSAAEAGAESIQLLSTDGFEVGQSIYVGPLMLEGVERAVVAEVVDQSELRLTSALKMAHAGSHAVTAVLGDRIKIYRTLDIDGSRPAPESFSVLTTRSIDPDQPSTYYRDADGGPAYWYAYSYFNPDTQEETARSEPFRGDDVPHYVSLPPIRKHAGFQSAVNLGDSYVEEARRKAESKINTALANRYTVPFNPVPEIIRTFTIQLAAAYLKAEAGYSDPKALQALENQLRDMSNGEGLIVDEGGNAIGASDDVSGYFGDEPRMFSVRQRF